MALSYKNDEDTDERLNPASELSRLENTQPEDAVDQGGSADDSTENTNVADAREKEQNAALPENPMGYRPSKPGSVDKDRLKKVVGFAKKRGGLIGLISLFGVTGGLLAGFFAPASMLIHVTENFTEQNDTSSVAMQRRFMKVFGLATTADSDALCSGPKIKCYAGKISNKALFNLHKKGVVANFDDGSSFDGTKKSGYPDKNPSSYTLDDGKGTTRTVPASEMPEFLTQKENRAFAAKVFGRAGAFNMRLRAWTGKHITNRLFAKYPTIDRKGGTADGDNTKLSAKERLARAKQKLVSKIPGSKQASAITADIRTRVTKNTTKMKKGGVGYMLAVGGCMITKTPKIIGGGVAAAQLAQIMPIAYNAVMSPGSKTKASYLSNITPADHENAAVLLTEKTPREGDGKLTSALDSPILLAAMGINKNRPAVSSFAPGYSLLSNPTMKGLFKLQDAADPACDVLMSPPAMYSAMAIDSAITVVLSSTVVLGALKVAGSFAVSYIISKVIGEVIASTAMNVIASIAENDDIPKAQGEALGDIIGISAAAFFAAGGIGRGLPTLKMSQLADFSKMALENEEFERDMDIATLSPFDTSSKYTFLGSILYNSRMAVLESGNYSFNLASILTAAPKIPFLSLTSPVKADFDLTASYCGYATDFMYNAPENEDDAPAINMAGLPCTGLTPEQDSMSALEAIDYILEEGWIDDEALFSETDSIDTLVTNRYIVPDTPLADFIEFCGDTATGDYIFNAAGCTIDTDEPEGSLEDINQSAEVICMDDENGDYVCVSDLPEEDRVTTAKGVYDSKSLVAMTVFLLDYQIRQSINGNDEGTEQSASDPAAGGGSTIVSGDWAHPAPAYTALSQRFGNPVNYKSGHPISGGWGHNGIDISGTRKSERVYAACSGTTTTSIAGEYTQVGTSTIVIDCGGGVTVGYHHAVLTAGSQVVAGQDIGYTDATGNWAGWHLHFTVKVNGVFVNPIPFMAERGITIP